ncbi:peptide chain release factor N(5)-glutamine methyltransferase [Rhizobium sp. RU20A]|uniref:peptide chain release factor N(5)-glutamine methyltransferase n=1 Tax=Rhizobium sp. RU20A TaxID=1907412 RepID=UPI00122D29C5|nr:peptide chain release factor N(5)-glutamine methyltransferase [Rhizobium sp. RU20A]
MAGTIDALLLACRRRLADGGVAEAGREARILVAGLLDFTATDLLTRGGDVVSDDAAARIEAGLARRLAGEPVHRILGRRDFRGLTLLLSAETLEPRPDTECLVDAVGPLVADCVARTGGCRILDLGTGTGAIILALLDEHPLARGVAVDLSADALATATANAERHGLVSRFGACRSDWFSAVDGVFDVIVSNPPYIASSIVDVLEPDVRDHDPRLALDGGADGLDAYRVIAAQSRRHLTQQGFIGLEIGYDQDNAVVDLFEGFDFRLVQRARDLGGRDRVLVFQPRN